MTFKATVKFSYTSDNQDPPSKWFPESVDCKTITVEAPAEDLNIHQYYELFKNFLGAAGFCEIQHYGWCLPYCLQRQQ